MIRIMIAVLLTFLFVPGKVSAQQKFPDTWAGNWKGELNWYRTGKPEPQKVNMELRIHKTDSINTWSWQIIYGSEATDNRPYKLILKDSAGIHWAIDENNGIVLDQYWVANKFTGAFTVMNSTIINNYWLDGDQLIIEFYNISAKPVATTGHGTDESPKVDSYKVSSYQKAVLKRVQ